MGLLLDSMDKVGSLHVTRRAQDSRQYSSQAVQHSEQKAGTVLQEPGRLGQAIVLRRATVPECHRDRQGRDSQAGNYTEMFPV